MPLATWHLGQAVRRAGWHLASLNLWSPARGSGGSVAYMAQSVKLPSDLGIFPCGGASLAIPVVLEMIFRPPL